MSAEPAPDWDAAEGISRMIPDSNCPTWDILITTLEERHAFLCRLLALLNRQIMPHGIQLPGVGVRVLRDNLEMRVGEKRQLLIRSSRARYVSFIDDDDEVAPNYVVAIREALRRTPDYVGFKVLWTTDGMPERPVWHSLAHRDWIDQPDALYRDLSHLNPIKRRLALRVPFNGGPYEDRRWATEMRRLGHVKREVFIDQQLYHYRFRNGDSHLTTRQPSEFFYERPSYPFVTWIEP